MSLYGALYAGVTGLAANSQAMGVISDNISNLNSVGYKATQVRFSTLVTGDSIANYAPGGVAARSQQLIDRQGVLQATASQTDLALQGNGFFVVSQPNSARDQLYTRAGSFTTDKNGNFVNSAGYILQGVPADPAGNLPNRIGALNELKPVNLSNVFGAPVATSAITLSANLQSSQLVNPLAADYQVGNMAQNANGGGGIPADFERGVTVYDSLGGSHTLNIAFLKTAVANQWRAEVFSVPATATTGADGLIASGVITFDGNGHVATSTLPTALNVGWRGANAAKPAAPQTIALPLADTADHTSLTQFDTPSNARNIAANGANTSTLAGVSVDKDGVITARFVNGTTRPIFRLAVATFTDANQLDARSGNAFAENLNSGAANLNYANTGAAAGVSAGSLEGSTVDLAKEFTDMIITQRAYSASSKIISTVDEMLAELIQSKR